MATYLSCTKEIEEYNELIEEFRSASNHSEIVDVLEKHEITLGAATLNSIESSRSSIIKNNKNSLILEGIQFSLRPKKIGKIKVDMEVNNLRIIRYDSPVVLIGEEIKTGRYQSYDKDIVAPEGYILHATIEEMRKHII